MAARGASTQAVPGPAGGAAITRLTGPLLGVVRILIGYLWWTQLLWKVPPRFGCQDGFVIREGNGGLCDWLGREVAYPKYRWYAAFVEQVIGPNLGVLGYLIVLGEATIAALLFFGVLTRLGGLLGFAAGLNLLIGLWNVPHEWYWTYLMLALINLALALTAAGRWLGGDAFLHPRAAAAVARGNRLGRIVAWLT